MTLSPDEGRARDFPKRSDETAQRYSLGSSLEKLSLESLKAGRDQEFLSREDHATTTKALRQIRRVYMDIDGTAVPEGATSFSDETIESFRRATRAGIELTVGPTGKPFEEAAPLWESLPTDIPVDVIIEKGAYRMHRDEQGSMTKVYLLASPEEEQAIAQLKAKFYPTAGMPSIGGKLEEEFGIVIVPAGSGAHQAVLSFDVLKVGSGRDFQNWSLHERNEKKVTDQALLALVEDRFRELVSKANIAALDKARIIHLGNGNIELAPEKVEKHLAIRQDILDRGEDAIAVVGDSGNDRPMLELAGQGGSISGCLILHREKAIELAPLVDFIVTGEAQVGVFLDQIVQAKAANGLPDLDTFSPENEIG
ncbi:MAG: HAD hydrolase family protein [Bdellovibrionales bacterium]|nr:HAD hydrolase family protein [Bdellovibrionales bacterium]